MRPLSICCATDTSDQPDPPKETKLIVRLQRIKQHQMLLQFAIFYKIIRVAWHILKKKKNNLQNVWPCMTFVIGAAAISWKLCDMVSSLSYIMQFLLISPFVVSWLLLWWLSKILEVEFLSFHFHLRAAWLQRLSFRLVGFLDPQINTASDNT